MATIFLSYQLGSTTEVFADVESAAGGGLSDALGVAGFVNVDVVRNPELGPSPYLARAMVRQIIPLSTEMVEAERGPLAPGHRVCRFDAWNCVLASSVWRTSLISTTAAVTAISQFMNWTVDNNGAYDYAADTRGYTVGLMAEYHDRNWAFRFGESLMPKVANGPDLEWNLRRARAENFELEFHPRVIANRGTTVSPAVVRESRQHGRLPRRPSTIILPVKHPGRRSRAHSLQTP